jgi:hypothetical protein
MSLRRILPIGLLALVALAAPAAAQANYVVAIGDQNPFVFSQPRFQALKIKKMRYLVPWDFYKDAGQAAEVANYMNAARGAKQDVLVSFTARRGCFNNGKYSRSKSCRAPSAGAYKSAFLRFDRLYPWVKTYSAWNEVNHVSQPTFKSPKLAARYYNVLRRYTRSRHFRLLAADVLDSSNVSRGTRAVLRAVPGEVWMTETGGILQFAPDFPRSESRAASRASYTFSLASKYSKRRSGYRSKITRLYYYQYTGADASARFDAGLVNPDGSPRKAYSTFLSKARHRAR